jgi:hypothetical protein
MPGRFLSLSAAVLLAQSVPAGADTRATFTLTGIVPVSCSARVAGLEEEAAELLVLVEERCNTPHAIEVSLAGAELGQRRLRIAYDGAEQIARSGQASFGRGAFDDGINELRISSEDGAPIAMDHIRIDTRV